MLLVALDTLLYWFLEWCQPAAEVGPDGSKSEVVGHKIKVNERNQTWGLEGEAYNPWKTNVKYPK